MQNLRTYVPIGTIFPSKTNIKLNKNNLNLIIMKKLGLTFAAIGLFFATASQAQDVEATTTTETEVVSETAVQTDDFKKVEVSELPEAVTAAIAADYEEATTQEAYVKEKDGKLIYKIKLDVNGEVKKVYVDAEGNWIKKEDKKQDY